MAFINFLISLLIICVFEGNSENATDLLQNNKVHITPLLPLKDTRLNKKFSLKSANHLLQAGRKNGDQMDIPLQDLGPFVKGVSIPFRSAFKMSPGQVVSFYATTPQDAEAFQLSFLRSSFVITDTGNVVFHMKFTFGDKRLVFNSMTERDHWDHEINFDNPITKEALFVISIYAFADRFMILYNYDQAYRFIYRAPLNQISSIEILGDVAIHYLALGAPYNALPFRAVFPLGHWQKGERIQVRGVPTGDIFNINILSINGDIGLIVSVRFNEQKIVLNTMIDGKWGDQEYFKLGNFEKYKGFDLMFFNYDNGLSISLHDEEMGVYKHRIYNPSTGYLGISIDSDLYLEGVDYLGSPK